MKYFKSTIVLHTFLLAFCLQMYAGTETKNNRIEGSQIVPSAAVGVQDNHFPIVAGPDFQTKSAKSKIIFSINHASPLYFNAGNTVRIGVLITTYNNTGLPQNLPLVELEVGYSPTGAYKDKSVYVIEGSHKVSAVIQYIHDGADNDLTAIPQNLSLEAEQTTERYYLFDPAVVGLTIPQIGYHYVAASNEIDIHWGMINGAEAYELEWTHVNNYGVESGTELSSADIDYNFKNNSTRVRVSQNHYPISLIFDQGYVLFRVRGVGKLFAYLNSNKEFFGKWSSDLSGGEGAKVAAYATEHLYKIESSNRHEINKNWQYSASYAEEGKKKEVISYFDGSLRNRQSVTKSNSHNNTIVGETIYDFQGRGAVQVLPTPTMEAAIHYYPDFNVEELSSSAYSRDDFDKDLDPANCDAKAAGMNTSSGSSRYYSSDNTDKTGFQSYLPTANLYPFSQVEYTQDNTGRIRKQGGVGPDFQLGSTHETQYFYGAPEQVELDRLFGSEVGSGIHYKKNMVIDPNGQISVSYLDQQARVIATSLAGNKPQNLDALVGGNPASEINAEQDLSNRDINRVDDNSLVFSKSLLVTTAGEYKFYYELEVPRYNDACVPAPICYDCVYELEISLLDGCGNQMFPSKSVLVGVDETAGIDTVCNDASNITYTLISSSEDPETATAPETAYLPVGSYTLSKRLTISEAAADLYSDNYVDNSTCLTPYTTFLDSAMAQIDTTMCEITCEMCIDQLGPLSAHNDFSKKNEPGYSYLTEMQWKAAYKECNAPCSPANLCEAQFHTLLSDVSPNGQYAMYNMDYSASNGTGAFSADDPLSVFNVHNKLQENFFPEPKRHSYWRSPSYITGLDNFAYYETDGSISKIIISQSPDGSYSPEIMDGASPRNDGDGSPLYIYPQELKHEIDFINRFSAHPEWAKSLVKFHPEFRYYAWCIKNSDPSYSTKAVGPENVPMTSDEYNDYIHSFDTGEGAIAAGVLNTNNTNFYELLMADPYFNAASPNDGQGKNQIVLMALQLANYHDSGMNLKQLCATTVRCGTVYYGDMPSGCNHFGAGTDADILNEEWQLYRNLYLAEKQRFQQNEANRYAKANIKYNGCIGVNERIYNPWEHAGEISFIDFLYGIYQFDPCGIHTFQLYKNKIKRFQNGNDAGAGMDLFSNPQAALDRLKNTAEYTMFLETGQCPISNELGFLLNDMAQHELLDAPSVDLANVKLFTRGLYDAIFAPTTVPANPSFIHYYWESTVNPDNTLEIKFREGTAGGASGPLDECSINLSFPANYNWSDVKRLANMNYINSSGGLSYFSMTAYLDADPSDKNAGTALTIYGNTCLVLNGCTFEDNCTASDEAKRIQNLFNTLITNSNLESSNVDLSVVPYSTMYSDQFILPLGVTYSSIVWNGTTNFGSIVTTLSDASSSNCSFSFTFENPAYSLNQVKYVAHVRPDDTDPTHAFFVDGWVIDHFEPIRVVNTEGCFNYQDCAPPVDLLCSGKDYVVNNTFMTGLNTIVRQGRLLTPFNLAPLPNFAALFFKTQMGITEPSHLNWDLDFYYLNQTTFETDKTLRIDIKEVAGTFLLQFDDLSNNHNFSDITRFSNLNVESVTEIRTSFSVMAKFSDGTTQLINCFFECYAGLSLLKPCEKCTEPNPNSVVMSMDFDDYDSENPGFSSTNGEYICNEETNGYQVVTNNTEVCPEWAGTLTGNDHTNPGIGKFVVTYLYFSAASVGNTIWEKTIPNIQTNTDYSFSYWITTPADVGESGFTQSVSTWINGVDQGSDSPVSNAVWTKVSKLWNSGSSSSINLQIKSNSYPIFVGIDDITLTNLNIEQTRPCTTVIPPEDTTTYTNPCIVQLKNIAKGNADKTYKDYIDKEKDLFRERYLDGCINAIEELSYVYTDREHHFTLYYYDQAGNLITTVPPEGVNVVSNAADLAQIKADREQNKQTFNTSHTLKTRYEYNSLNQLMRQATPDNALIDKWSLNGAGDLPPASNIYGMAFRGANNGFAVGDDGAGNGIIYITNDGGEAWNAITSMGVDKLIDVQFIESSSTGFAISDKGYLLKTIDNGISWITLSTGSTSALTDLYFSNASNGFVIGKNGTLLQTVNGGDTWAQPTIEIPITGINLNDMYFYTSSFGVIVGDQSTIIKTFDGGANWTIFSGINVNPLPSNLTLNAVHFRHAFSGTIAGVDDLGNSVIYDLSFNASDKIWSDNLSPAGTSCVFNTLFAIPPGKDVYAGATNGKMFYSSDGISFTEQAIAGFSGDITEITFPEPVNNPSIGYAATADGNLLKLSTGGTGGTWNLIAPVVGANPNSVPLNGLYFPASMPYNVGYAAGDHGTLLKTNDGGLNWTSLSEIPFPLLKDASLAAGSALVGYAVGENGSVLNTQDGGFSWIPIVHDVSSQTLNAVLFENSSIGIAVGNNGEILKITNDLSSSPSVEKIITNTSISSNFNDIALVSGSYVVVGDAGKIVSGTSAATTFTALTSPTGANLNAISFFGQLGFSVGDGGTILKSINGGANWVPVTSGVAETLRDVHLTDNLTGYAVGDNGVFLKTTDAGENWDLQVAIPAVAGNFHTTAFTSEGIAFMAGTGASNLNKLVDERSDYSSRFWYDRLGRLVLSQNSKQFNKAPVAYSYTLYDALGRIIEVGETSTDSDINTLADNHGVLGDDAAFAAWLTAGTHTEITHTYYDAQKFTGIPLVQENLRTRVASVTYEDTNDDDEQSFNHATHYSYDIHGNVKSLIQDNPDL